MTGTGKNQKDRQVASDGERHGSAEPRLPGGQGKPKAGDRGTIRKHQSGGQRCERDRPERPEPVPRCANRYYGGQDSEPRDNPVSPPPLTHEDLTR